MSKKKTQCEKIVEYMRQFGTITPLEAMRDLGVMRLGARVWDLENKNGFVIRHQMIKVKNRFGTDTIVCQYSLVEAKDA